ncbi:MAG: DUF4255 domain-containing protein [Verrucomicrobia bacterium]|nr:DUF4255 domain-containing protein [Verrucomicrobiota bacterium]
MSNPWAIAAVTAVLRHSLRQQLEAAAIGGVIHDADAVALPPDRVTIGADQPSRLNLFLYEITNNAALSNDRLPLRSSDRTPVNIPHLALNLRYLLIACGAVDLENEILLAHGLQAFSKSPVVPRQTIRTVLDPSLPDGAGVPPRAFREQAVAVAEQFELLKVTPVFLHYDEMSKIWAGLQSAYRPCVVLEVTAVIVEEAAPVSRALPVLHLGDAGRGWESQANLLSSAPLLLAVRPPQRQPAAPASGTLDLIGAGFNGAGLRARFRQDRLAHLFEVAGAAITPVAAAFTDAEIAANPDLAFATHVLSLNLAAATIEGSATTAPWAAGLYSVDVALTPTGRPGEAFSNQLSAAIAPAFTTAGPNAPSAAVNGDDIEVTLHCAPPVRARQAATIMVGGFEFPPLTPEADAAVPVFTGTVPDTLRGATHPLRLRIDGVDSLFIDRAANPPAFAAGHIVAIPA